ncbi:hypothetical protein M4S82_15925, partial [Planococcus sp. MERTA32b]|nr:hypothetical protein [Planococcus sp. MER TA 32b]
GVLCRRAEMAYDPRSWALESGHKKSASARSAPKDIRRISGAAFFAAELRWLMIRGVGRWSLDTRKAQAPVQL